MCCNVADVDLWSTCILSRAKKVITVHVHPPSKQGEQNREVITVTKVEPEDTADDLVEADEKEAILRHELVANSKGKFIVVDLPEGSTIKQQYVRTTERYDVRDLNSF